MVYAACFIFRDAVTTGLAFRTISPDGSNRLYPIERVPWLSNQRSFLRPLTTPEKRTHINKMEGMQKKSHFVMYVLNHPELISFRKSLCMYFVLYEERGGRREKREKKRVLRDRKECGGAENYFFVERQTETQWVHRGSCICARRHCRLCVCFGVSER